MKQDGFNCQLFVRHAGDGAYRYTRRVGKFDVAESMVEDENDSNDDYEGYDYNSAPNYQESAVKPLPLGMGI